MTILYSAAKQMGYGVVFKGSGSVLFQPRTIFSACIAGLLAAIVAIIPINDALNQAIGEPAILFSSISFLVGFVLVYRAQTAYMRHKTALAQTQRMFSSMRSLATSMRTFTPNESIHIKIFMRLRVFSIIATDLLRAKPIDFDYLLETNLLTPDEALLLIGKQNQAGILLTWISDIVAVFSAAAHKTHSDIRRNNQQSLQENTRNRHDKRDLIYRHITSVDNGHAFSESPQNIISFVCDPQLSTLWSTINEIRFCFEQAESIAEIPYPFP